MPRSACRRRAGAYDLIGVGPLGVARLRIGRGRPAAWPCCATSAPACPAAATRPTGGDAAVALRCSATGRRDRRDDRRRRRPPASSSTAGACPATPARKQWEERFGEHAYVPLAEEAVDRRAQGGRARRRTTSTTSIVTGLHARAVAGGPPRPIGARPEALADDLTARRSATPASPRPASCSPTCSTGPSPARRSPWSQLADGCDVWLLRTTDGARRRTGARPTVREQIAATPRRPHLRRVPHLARASSTASRRAGPSPTGRPRRRRCAATQWKYGFVGTPATSGGFVHLPPSRVQHGAAARSTRWTRCAWPTCRPRSPPSPSTAWPTR